MKLRVASYNVHGFVGCDKRYSPERCASLIAELGADMVGLQEVVFEDRTGCPHDGLPLALTELPHRASAVTREHGEDRVFGNALLSRHPIVSAERIVLDYGRREPRTALDCLVEVAGLSVRVLVAHLGLHAKERAAQVETLLDAVQRAPAELCILMGDFNEWFVYGRARRRMERFFGGTHALASYPSRRAIFALDRIWVRPASALAGYAVVNNPSARVTSDHLPVTAEIAAPALQHAEAARTPDAR